MESTAKDWQIDLTEDQFINLFQLVQTQVQILSTERTVLRAELKKLEDKVAALEKPPSTTPRYSRRRYISRSGRVGFQFAGYIKGAPEDVKKKARELRDNNGYAAAVSYLQKAYPRKTGRIMSFGTDIAKKVNG